MRFQAVWGNSFAVLQNVSFYESKSFIFQFYRKGGVFYCFDTALSCYGFRKVFKIRDVFAGHFSEKRGGKGQDLIDFNIRIKSLD